MSFAVELTSLEAWIFLPLIVPVGLWAIATDLKFMAIRNLAVLALLAGFAILGPFALPFDAYLWRYAHFAVVLAIGFLLWSFPGIGFGAGDAKFAAAIAPFVALGDWSLFLLILSGTSILGVILHRVAKRMPVVVNATPGWVSWEDGKAFPFGVSLASALILYIVLGLSQTGL
ncbi:MAG: hypothetical protein AAGA70_10410 [Pseudomonadota bacterium]